MFIGRENELAALKERFSAASSTIIVVYGRRRIGKSSLIEEAARGFRFFSFEGLENASSAEQQNVFIKQLADHGVKIPSNYPRDWFSLLRLLGKLSSRNISDNRATRGPETTVILLDEFQWLANYRNELVSNLKLVWDQHLKKLGDLRLVLCGSVASFMVRKVLKSKALYGRVDLSIHLRSLSLSEAKEMLPNRSLDELILAYLFFGGVPKYLSLLGDRDSVLRSLEFHCMNYTAYFAAEYDRIFVSHFGKNKAYSRIIRYLASKPNGASRAAILKDLALPNSGQTSELLENLEFSGFIRSAVPFDKKASSIHKLYYLADYYLRFYLTFIEPLIQHGELERVDFINQVFNSPKMRSWLGFSFENLCLDHAEAFAKLMGFSGVRYRVGPYFKIEKDGDTNSKNQLDLVFDRQDMVCTVCEVKYQSDIDLKQVSTNLDRVISKIKYFKRKTVNKVLITAGGNHQNNPLYFSRIINIQELLGL